MKNKDLSNAIGNINLKYVEEAENFTAKRMSLTKIISLAACIAIIATSIPLALVLNREDAQTDAPVETTPFVIETTEPDKGNDNINIDNDNNTNTDALKVIYCDAQMVGEIENAKYSLFKDSNVVVRRIDGFFGNLIEYKDAEYNPEIPKQFTITLGNYEFECYFDYAYNTKAMLSEDEALRSYAEIACYKIDQKGYSGELHCRVADKKILRVSINREYQIPSDIKTDEELDKWYNDNLGGSLTNEDILALSEKDMVRLYGEDALSKYKLDENMSKDRKLYYRRYINGFETSEAICLRYTTKGEILDLHIYWPHPFELVEDDLNEEKLLKADVEALKILDENHIQFKELVMSSESEIYIHYRLMYEGGRIYEVYYKVG